MNQLDKDRIKMNQLDKEIKELDKELQLATLEILISLAEYRERTYEVKKLNQIKQFIEKL
jgi:hypothetical protein